MAQPYIGEIRMFAGNFAPAGWMFCQGQLLAISENDTLFALIGTTYGGDGEETFGLPDLRGRLPIHQGQGQGLSNRVLAETGGSEEVTLTLQQIPNHGHTLMATGSTATSQDPSGQVPAAAAATVYFNLFDNPTTMAPGAIAPAGGSQPHSNFQPYLCVDFIISLFGIFPSQT